MLPASFVMGPEETRLRRTEMHPCYYAAAVKLHVIFSVGGEIHADHFGLRLGRTATLYKTFLRRLNVSSKLIFKNTNVGAALGYAVHA